MGQNRRLKRARGPGARLSPFSAFPVEVWTTLERFSQKLEVYLLAPKPACESLRKRALVFVLFFWFPGASFHAMKSNDGQDEVCGLVAVISGLRTFTHQKGTQTEGLFV